MYEAYRELRTVKHTVNKHIVKLDLDLDIFGALCPSKSGLMNKHIVKHIVRTETLGRDANHPWPKSMINHSTIFAPTGFGEMSKSNHSTTTH